MDRKWTQRLKNLPHCGDLGMVTSVTMLFLCVLLIGASLVAGCDAREDSNAGAKGARSASGPVQTGKGIIRGVVTLSGTPPQMKVIRNEPCHAGAKPISEETVVADAAGHLA